MLESERISLKHCSRAARETEEKLRDLQDRLFEDALGADMLAIADAIGSLIYIYATLDYILEYRHVEA